MSINYVQLRHLGERDVKQATVIDTVTLSSGAVLTHEGFDVSGMTSLLLHIESTARITVYPQFSHDNTNWYDYCDAAGTAISYTVDNEKKAIGIQEGGRYFRVVIYANAAATVSVTITATV